MLDTWPDAAHAWISAHLDLGDVPTAITATIALAALVAAIKAFRAQNRQIMLQQRQLDDQVEMNRLQTQVLTLQAEEMAESLAERQRESQRQRRMQAAQIIVWIDVEGNSTRPIQKGVGTTWILHVKNASPYPIFEVYGRWLKAGERFMVPGNLPENAVAPGNEMKWELGLSFESVSEVTDMTAVVEFRDAYDIRWRKSANNELAELTEYPPHWAPPPAPLRGYPNQETSVQLMQRMRALQDERRSKAKGTSA